MHFGRLISKLKKSLSPVIIIATFDAMAAFRICCSLMSRIFCLVYFLALCNKALAGLELGKISAEKRIFVSISICIFSSLHSVLHLQVLEHLLHL